MNYILLTSFVMGNYNLDLKDGIKKKFMKIANEYIEYKKDNRLYDFTDLPQYLYDMLNLYGERITNVDALFVDEFQDVDPTQADIFDMVDANKHFYIGDPDQSIYMFRHALPDVIDVLKDKGFKKRMLDENYRSYQSIIDFSTAIRTTGVNKCVDITHLTGSWIKCVRKDQPGEVYTLKSRNECYDLIRERAEDPEKLIHYFIEKKPFILCRSNKQVKRILELGYKNVSTVHQAKGLEYSDVVFTDCYLASEEEINIAYVACTRAENSLLVTSYDIFFEILATIISEEGKEIYQPKLF